MEYFVISSSTFCNSPSGLHKLMLFVYVKIHSFGSCTAKQWPSLSKISASVSPTRVLVHAHVCKPLREALNRLVMSGDAAVKRKTNLRMSIEYREMSVSRFDAGLSIVIIIT